MLFHTQRPPGDSVEGLRIYSFSSNLRFRPYFAVTMISTIIHHHASRSLFSDVSAIPVYPGMLVSMLNGPTYP